MDHNTATNIPLHWSYNSPPPTIHSTPTISQNQWHSSQHVHGGIKRTISESDCEELFSEESSKEQISPSESGSCQMMSRKKRRGVIEKKRRDRINSSLSELKRLVPSAYEKQGSAKLEKAEILQLTVEHLKNLHTKGIDSLSYDPQRFAMDNHIIGFRECAAEVARYLVTIEGMDIQDPLRLRLMSHLQYFAQQRELTAKGCTNYNSWIPPNTYQTNSSVNAYQSYPNVVSTPIVSNSAYVPNLPTPIHPYPVITASVSSTNVQDQNSGSIPHSHSMRPNSTNLPTNDSNHTSVSQAQVQNITESTHRDTESTTYMDLTNAQGPANTVTGTVGTNANYYPAAHFHPVTESQDFQINTTLNYGTNSDSKPYRPWGGAELAY